MLPVVHRGDLGIGDIEVVPFSRTEGQGLVTRIQLSSCALLNAAQGSAHVHAGVTPDTGSDDARDKQNGANGENGPSQVLPHG